MIRSGLKVPGQEILMASQGRYPGRHGRHPFLIPAAALLFMVLPACTEQKPGTEICRYPAGKGFAFTITEDPDYSKMADMEVMYEFIESLGMKTSIAVWVMQGQHGSGSQGRASNTRGLTTNNPIYYERLLDLKKNGFEICLHTVSAGNDLREETIEGYEIFQRKFGAYPRININHANNLENIYWGKNRFSNPMFSAIYGIWAERYQGDEPGSKYFWGDICRSKTNYVRSWATDNVNTLAVNKSMPYHLPDKPYVNGWFGCSDGYNCEKFLRLISDRNIDKLIQEKGTCIVYTHFAYGFVDDHLALNERFKEQMQKLSKKNGWFVPASTILDRLSANRRLHLIEKGDGRVNIVNRNPKTVEDVAVRTDRKALYFEPHQKWIEADENGVVVLGDIEPDGETGGEAINVRETFPEPSAYEKARMIMDWIRSR